MNDFCWQAKALGTVALFGLFGRTVATAANVGFILQIGAMVYANIRMGNSLVTSMASLSVYLFVSTRVT